MKSLKNHIVNDIIKINNDGIIETLSNSDVRCIYDAIGRVVVKDYYKDHVEYIEYKYEPSSGKNSNHIYMNMIHRKTLIYNKYQTVIEYNYIYDKKKNEYLVQKSLIIVDDKNLSKSTNKEENNHNKIKEHISEISKYLKNNGVKNNSFMDTQNLIQYDYIQSEVLTEDGNIKNLPLALKIYDYCKDNFWLFFRICKIKDENQKLISPKLKLNNTMMFFNLINGNSIYNLHSRKLHNVSTSIEIYKKWLSLFYDVSINEYKEYKCSKEIIVPKFIIELSECQPNKDKYGCIDTVEIIHEYSINKKKNIPKIDMNNLPNNIQYIIESHPVKLSKCNTSGLEAYHVWKNTFKFDIYDFDTIKMPSNFVGIQTNILDCEEICTIQSLNDNFKMLNNDLDIIKVEYMNHWF